MKKHILESDFDDVIPHKRVILVGVASYLFQYDDATYSTSVINILRILDNNFNYHVQGSIIVSNAKMKLS